MDYKNFQEKPSPNKTRLCPRVFKLRKRTDVFCRPDRQRTDQSAPLSPATDVQGLYRLYTPVGTQLSKGCYDERNKWASYLAAAAYDRLTEDNLIYDPEYTNFKK